MKLKKYLAVCTTALLALGLAGFGTAAAVGDDGVTTITWDQSHNQASYWSDYGPHDDASCYKHEANSNGNSSSDHGSSTGNTVTLATFDQSWPGDHWELLVIKAGLKETVVIHPDAGVAYSAPDGKNVSHWIVCKGTTPAPPKIATASATVVTLPGCGVEGKVTFSKDHADWQNSWDTSDGSRTAYADSGYKFADGSTTLVVTYTPVKALDDDDPLCTVTPGTPTVVQAGYVCNPDGSFTTTQATITLSPSDHFTWKLKQGSSYISVPDGVRNATPGTTYKFKADADNHYSIADGYEYFTVVVNSLPQAPTCVIAPPVVPTVTSSSQTCDTTNGQAGTTPGTITLADGHWTWYDANNVEVSSGVAHDYAAGTYSFTAVADTGFKFDSEGTTTLLFPVTVELNQIDGPCLIEVTPVKPAVTSTDECGIANDTLTVDSSMPGVLYSPVTWNQDHTVATVTASVSDPSVYFFKANTQTSWNFEFTNEPCVVTVDVEPSATAQECMIDSQSERVALTTLSTPGYTYEDGGITVVLDPNLEYTITGGTLGSPLVVTTAFTALDPGDYTVTVKALNGYVLGEGPASWPLTVGEGLCAVTFGDPTATDQTCSLLEEDTTVSGYIWVDFGESEGFINPNLRDEVSYQIVGGAYNYTAEDEINNLPPGTYTVTVTAKTGFVLDPSMESEWTFTIAPAGTCTLITHPFISTTATSTNTTCTASGTYTLANTEGVLWFVNGSETPTAPGTYKVTKASTVNVEAQVVDETYGWEDDAQTQWTFNFTDPADCLSTLAFTGASGGNLGLLLSGGLLLFGGAIIAFDRRFRFGSR